MAAFQKCINAILLQTLLWWWLLVPANCWADAFLPHSHYKYQVTLKVSQKIAAAKGDARKMPAVEVNPKRRSTLVIAKFVPKPHPTVVVDEQLYDLCVSLGPDSLDALACIIGHEMAHYYENHSWTNSFADLMGVPLEAKPGTSSQEKSLLEAEADYFGVFYGFMAGYNTFGLLPQVLEAIYHAYNLPDQLQGYPSKQDRLRLSMEKEQELRPLLHAFRGGQLLYLRKKYEEAAVCFDYILSNYPGREVYNNAGVVRLAQAVQLLETEQVYFAYPFELDANTRLKRGRVRATNNGNTQKQKARELLTQAQSDFEKAVAIDNSYSSGYINLACVFSLLDNQAGAIGKINELENFCQRTGQELPGNANMIRGIALVKNSQKNEAKKDFDLAVKKKAYLAEYNQTLFKKLMGGWQDKAGDWLTHWPTVESWIHGYWGQPKNQVILKPEELPDTGLLVRSSSGKPSQPMALLIPDRLHPVEIIGLETSKVYHLQLDISDYYLQAFFFPTSQQSQTSLGVKVGTSLGEVRKKYGSPSSTAAGLGSRQYLSYDDARVIFEMEDDRVKAWWVYKISY